MPTDGLRGRRRTGVAGQRGPEWGQPLTRTSGAEGAHKVRTSRPPEVEVVGPQGPLLAWGRETEGASEVGHYERRGLGGRELE
jgi:hypothetical protein